jgi:Ca2+-binding EF-hand superfamily protein
MCPLQTKLMEPPNHLEWRIQELFRSLDVANKGYLDLKNLRDGLKRIDHRMYCLPTDMYCS